MKNRIFNNTTSTSFNDDVLYGGVEYNRVLNSDTNLQVGDVSSAYIKFKVKTNSFTVGDELGYYIIPNALILIGVFYVTDIVKGKTDYTITAYDAVSKLDVDCTEWKQSLTLPMTLKQVFRSIGTYLGIQTDGSNFVNYDFSFNTNYLDDGLSFRQVISYIAQCAGGFAYMDNYYLTIGKFDLNSTFRTFTSSNYKRLEVADYEVKPIDAVWLGMEDGDVGTIYTETSDPENIFRMYNNPFFYIDDYNNQLEIEDRLHNIYDVLKNYTYTPFKLETFTENVGKWYGQKITIDGDDYLPFSISWNKSGMTIESTGEPDRNKVQMFSAAEQRMSGKFNIFSREIDETQSQIGNVQGQISTVSQTVDGVQITLQTAIDGVQDNLNEHAAVQLQYIQYGAEGLTLGKESSSTKTRLTNERLEFIDGTGDIKGYIGYDSVEQTYKFYITNGHINNYLEYGDSFSAIASADGHHLTFKGKV